VGDGILTEAGRRVATVRRLNRCADSLVRYGQCLQNACPQGAATGPSEVPHRGDQLRLDPADAADRSGHGDAGLRAGEEGQRLAGIAVQNTRAGKLHPADQPSRIAVGDQRSSSLDC
jgi:hypothetical protein